MNGDKGKRIILILLAALLTFAGPTYLVLALSNIVKVNYFLSMVSGLAAFIVGLALIWFLIKEKIVS